tara:strand:- start:9 stop:818 length:810 start_codon:yes stop_codon:yes gene_type:complete
MKHPFLIAIALVLLNGCSSDIQKKQIFNSEGKIQPKLINPLIFSEFTINDLDEVEDISALFDARIDAGYDIDEPILFMRLKEDDPDSYINTETANDYLAAIKIGAFPMTTADIAVSSFFVEVVPILVFLKQSKPSSKSLLYEDLMDISISVFPWSGSDEKKQIENDSAAGLTVSDYLKKGLITEITRESINEIRFKTNYPQEVIKHRKEVIITELARGDYDGDGFEDSMISISTYYLEGSGRNYHSHIVTRSEGQSFMKIEQFIIHNKK